MPPAPAPQKKWVRGLPAIFTIRTLWIDFLSPLFLLFTPVCFAYILGRFLILSSKWSLEYLILATMFNFQKLFLIFQLFLSTSSLSCFMEVVSFQIFLRISLEFLKIPLCHYFLFSRIACSVYLLSLPLLPSFLPSLPSSFALSCF